MADIADLTNDSDFVSSTIDLVGDVDDLGSVVGVPTAAATVAAVLVLVTIISRS